MVVNITCSKNTVNRGSIGSRNKLDISLFVKLNSFLEKFCIRSMAYCKKNTGCRMNFGLFRLHILYTNRTHDSVSHYFFSNAIPKNRNFMMMEHPISHDF